MNCFVDVLLAIIYLCTCAGSYSSLSSAPHLTLSLPGATDGFRQDSQVSKCDDWTNWVILEC